MDSSSVVLLLRVALSLACVLGLLWFLGRRMAKSGAVRRTRASAIDVLARQSLGGKAGVVLVEVDGRRLLLGVAEQNVRLLTEIAAPPADPTTDDARVEIDPADLERLWSDVPDDVSTLTPSPTASQPAPTEPGHLSPSTPAARMPAVPTPRNPLEGSILDAATWRRAVVAVQERTIRR